VLSHDGNDNNAAELSEDTEYFKNVTRTCFEFQINLQQEADSANKTHDNVSE
jgi:hypothetical protein